MFITRVSKLARIAVAPLGVLATAGTAASAQAHCRARYRRSVTRHVCAFVLLGWLAAPAPGFAAPPSELASPVRTSQPESRLVLPSPARLLALTSGYTDDIVVPAPAPVRQEHPQQRAVLSSLHAVTGVVQMWDGMLTKRVLDAGGREANPMMMPVARHTGALMAVKIGAAVATVIGTETMWHDGHRLAAILTSVAASSAMAMVAHHNSQVLARMEGR